mgnify:CR=1 FL=1|jgi:hypothetical protein
MKTMSELNATRNTRDQLKAKQQNSNVFSNLKQSSLDISTVAKVQTHKSSNKNAFLPKPQFSGLKHDTGVNFPTRSGFGLASTQKGTNDVKTLKQATLANAGLNTKNKELYQSNVF